MDPSIAQFTKGERPRPASVIAPLLYLGRSPDVPVSYVGTPPVGTPADNCEYVARSVVIHDARDTVRLLALDRNGFELWQAPTTVGDFLDEDEVRRRYYPEVAELVLGATGGDEAHVFDHLVRRRELGRPPMTFGARHGTFAGPAGRVHVDYTETSGARRFELVLEGATPVGRFAIVNVWRSIGSAPVLDTPLALCDARSVHPGDLVASEHPLPGTDRGDLPRAISARPPLDLRLGDAPGRGAGLQAVRLGSGLRPVRPPRRLRPSGDAPGRAPPSEHRGPGPGDLPMSIERPVLEFWFDLASNYSYLTLMRIDALAERSGVTVRWEPFLLGPIFEAFGWNSSPFVLQKEKGAYVWKDMERQARKYGLPWRKPSLFPQNTVLPVRVALLGRDEQWMRPFCRAMSRAAFAEERDISSVEAVTEVLESLALPAAGILARVQSPAEKPALRAQVQRAQSLGIFGAPTFFVRGEMFWGNDRLEDALEAAVGAAVSLESP